MSVVGPYPAYKDSGVEWIGAMPAGWTVTPLGAVTRGKCDGPFGSGLKSEHYTDGGVRVVRLQNIRGDAFDDTDAAYIDSTYYETALGGHDVKGDDVLIAGLGDDRNTVGRACVAPIGIEPAMVKADCFRFRLDPCKAMPDFVALQLTASSPYDAGVLSSGSTRSRIPLSVMATRRLALPPVKEQRAIIAFLDHETGKIDALVAEKERLMALLKENRQALISQAVTKGLDPNAPMKHSGVEWLGDVPNHWGVLPLMRLADPERPIMYGIILPGPDVGEGIPIVKGGNVRPSRLNLQSLARTTAELEAPYARARLREGDLVYSIRGSIGDCELVPKELHGCNITQDVARVALTARTDAEWTRYALLSSPVREALACGSLGAAVRGINIFDLKRVRIPTPPKAEQCQIARHLNKVCQQADALIAEAEYAIALLQERRSALISAAVTGKIDVRGLVPEARQAA